MNQDTSQLITREAAPYNSEPSSTDLVGQFTTPTELLYCRNHGAIPQIEAGSYRLRVGGLVKTPQEFTLEELRGFPTVEAPYTLQCAGNRRSEFERFTGTPWQSCAIGNPLWKGLRLRDLLQTLELDKEVRYLHLVGSDETEVDGNIHPFAMSITLAVAMRDETLLAYEMNGEPLNALHGYPIRAVVPGLIAARSIKWLKAIELSDSPTQNPHYARDYKFVPQGIDEDEIPWAGLPPIASFQMTSVIASPENGSTVPSGLLKVRGYAIAEGHRDNVIERIEIKVDGEKNWSAARITSPQQPFCWTLWEHELSLEPGDHRLEVRVWDSRGRLQPQTPAPNLKGYLNEGWHSVSVSVGAD